MTTYHTCGQKCEETLIAWPSMFVKYECPIHGMVTDTLTAEEMVERLAKERDEAREAAREIVSKSVANQRSSYVIWRSRWPWLKGE